MEFKQQYQDCCAEQNGTILTIKNNQTALCLSLRNGVPRIVSWKNRATGYDWMEQTQPVPLFCVPGFSFAGANVSARMYTDDCGGCSEPALCTQIAFTQPEHTVTLQLRLYPDNPFFALEITLNGTFGGAANVQEATTESGIETGRAAAAAHPEEAMFAVPMRERHLRVRTVTLTDVTDGHNTLVQEQEELLYPFRALEACGQLFVLTAYLRGEAMMLVKDAPCAAARLHQPAWDLQVKASDAATLRGFGFDFSTPCVFTDAMPLYGCTVGVGVPDTMERRYRAFYRSCNVAMVRRGSVLTSNTWGDRNQDAAVCAPFMQQELVCAERLGVQVVQIDDGWQKGKTANSKLARSSVWGSGYYAADPDFWMPNPEKFPDGLAPLCRSAAQKQLQLGLWFSPDMADGYAHWAQDAQTLLGLWRAYQIHFFKLDGIRIRDKQTEENLLRMVRLVHQESGGAVDFHFDITAQERFGYLYRKEYGLIFLENRYTDWGNYYPHFTLRNLWQLCRYIPPIRLQMEFLNVRRNPQKYADDPLAPGAYAMDYVFATVLFANPLCWMEMSALSEADAAQLKKIIAVYRTLAPELGLADVTPLGAEPDGTSFTGLRADCGDHGYLLLFREQTVSEKTVFSIPELDGAALTTLYASGQTEAALSGAQLHFYAAQPRSFALLRYQQKTTEFAQ